MNTTIFHHDQIDCSLMLDRKTRSKIWVLGTKFQTYQIFEELLPVNPPTQCAGGSKFHSGANLMLHEMARRFSSENQFLHFPGKKSGTRHQWIGPV